jgi:Mg2+/Co2+ transporter CorB
LDDIPLSAQLTGLFALLLFSGFFSMSETAMMAANRFRLRHLAKAGHRGAQIALSLLEQTDKLLGVILLGNNLINSAAAMLVGLITFNLFGEDKWALGIGTLLVTFAILVIAEISPKIVGAAYADKITPHLAYFLAPLLKVAYPIVWFVDLFASALLTMLHLKPKNFGEAPRLTAEEMRSLVLEAGHILPPKHRSLMANIFELGQIRIDDVMTPRGSIEAIDLEISWTDIRERLATSHHTRLLCYRGELNNVLGILHLRRIAGRIGDDQWTQTELEASLQPPYFVPATTPVLSQLQFFQENRQRMGIVIDEYGEVLGLVTPEDIIEEIVGEFTVSSPAATTSATWDESGSLLVEGSRSLRELNRSLNLDFPLDGPNTLNGLIIEQFQDIPEAGVSLKIGNIPVEIVHTQDRIVKTVRIFKPLAP